MKEIKILNTIINLCIAAYLILFLSQIMHWIESNHIKNIVSGSLSIAIILRFFYFKNKVWYDYLVLVACLVVILSIIDAYFPNYFLSFFQRYTFLSIAFLIVNQVTYINKKQEPILVDDDYKMGQEEFNDEPMVSNPSAKNNINYLVKVVFGVFIALIILGFFFKTQHYPGSTILNITGYSGAVLCLMFLLVKR